MAKVMTDAAGKFSTLIAGINSHMEKLEKLSPAYHADRLSAAHSSTLPKSSPSSASRPGSSSPFYGFTDSDAANAAKPDQLYRYMVENDPETGPGCLPGIIQCGEQVPKPPTGTHMHHIYVDDNSCQHDERDTEQVLAGDYDDFSSDEEEIRVKETRDTVTTVTMGKKRTAAKKMLGRPPSKRRN